MSSAATSELPECPLCMEAFELDDLNFFPCTCGYQICRFCWHRIRTDENGLCPACRKAYPEDPAQFKPLTEDEVQRIKKDWKQKESQRKQKSAESRKHLTNVRVVQKNLVFVVGLSQRLTDPEVLKRHEYFGKFGKIHKVVINQSTSYVGSQGPSASAYVTYIRPEDALAAIKVVNNLQTEGRTLKASLGTTKYCSHFLKGTQCMKPDCMYLHDYGDESASFTKEEIQQGKHLQYEQKLHEQYSSSSSSSSSSHRPPTSSSPDAVTNHSSKTLNHKSTHSRLDEFGEGSSGELSPVSLHNTPPGEYQLSQLSPTHLSPVAAATADCSAADPLERRQEASDDSVVPVTTSSVDSSSASDSLSASAQSCSASSCSTENNSSLDALRTTLASCHITDNRSSVFSNGLAMDSLSLFSDNGFTSNRNSKSAHSAATGSEESSTPCREPEIAESMPVKSNTNWQEAFGFTSDNDNQDDDLGFDPWDVSARGLADMIENEKVSLAAQPKMPGVTSTNPLAPTNGFIMPPNFHPGSTQFPLQRFPMPFTKMLPPGFTSNGFLPPVHSATLPPQFLPPPGRSKMLNLMHQAQQQQQQQQQHQHTLTNNHLSPPVSYTNNNSADLLYGQFTAKPDSISSFYSHHQSNNIMNNDEISLHKWQEGFRALLPNINISFGTPSTQQQQPASSSSAHAISNSLLSSESGLAQNGSIQSQSISRALPAFDRTWCSSSHSMPDLSFDPAIVNSGGITDGSSYGEEPPHWMASLHHLTDDQHTSLPLSNLSSASSTLGSPPHLPWMSTAPPTARYPPPGFSMNLPRQNSEPQSVGSEQKKLQTSALQ